MSDSATSSDDLREELAKRAADAARETAENRDILADDPEFVEAQYWLAESRGERRAIARALARLQKRRDTRPFTMLGFTDWAWHQHTATNERRSDATGQAAAAASGRHHGYYEVLDAIDACTDLGFEDYADAEVA